MFKQQQHKVSYSSLYQMIYKIEAGNTSNRKSKKKENSLEKIEMIARLPTTHNIYSHQIKSSQKRNGKENK